MSKNYETVIGLEVHVELATKTKIFCSCSTEFGGKPNTHTCPVCTGMPGSLPVLNKQVVEYAMAVGLATNCSITRYSKFDRKNYFYPDNPQNYQISQLYLPICRNGQCGDRDYGRQKDRVSASMRSIWRKMPVNWYMMNGRTYPSWTTTVPVCR
ncbi:MAG: hypothetical protein ACLUD0_20010 [Eubacterium ramulus]